MSNQFAKFAVRRNNTIYLFTTSLEAKDVVVTSVSNVKSADVSLTTALWWPRSSDVIHEFHCKDERRGNDEGRRVVAMLS